MRTGYWAGVKENIVVSKNLAIELNRGFPTLMGPDWYCYFEIEQTHPT